VQLSDVLFLANGFQGSMVFLVGPFRQLIGELSSKLLHQPDRLRLRFAYPAAGAELGLIARQKTARH